MTLLKDQAIHMDEKIAYKNFDFNAKSDEVKFDTNSLFTLIEGNSTESNATVTHLNQGLLEALTTLTNPSQYQQGLNSLYLLFNKAIGTPDEFIRKLFTVFAYEYLIVNQNKVLNTMLKNYPPEQAEEIYLMNKEYSIG